MSLDIGLDQEAFAIRPVRVVSGQLREYEAVTFPDNPWQGCEMWLRRCRAFGYLAGGEYAVIDILSANGDIIQDFQVSKDGFNYLRDKLKFRVCKGG